MATAVHRRSVDGHPIGRRLQLAVALSVLAHVTILGALTRLPRPVPLPLPVAIGAPFVLHAVLQGQLAVVPPPQPEFAPVPEPPPLLTQPAVAAKAPEPISVNPVSTFGRRQGPPVQSADSDKATFAQGRVTSGYLKDPKALGDLNAVNLALRYPTTISKPPALRGSLSVVYPLEALMARVGMHIAAVVTVDVDGNVVGAVASPADPWFGPAIMAALQGARFTPAEINGERIPYWVIFDFDFAIVSK